MNLINNCQKEILMTLKNDISELQDITLEDLSDTEALQSAWELLSAENETLNNNVKYIIEHINEFHTESAIDFEYVGEIHKDDLYQVGSLNFYYSENKISFLINLYEQEDISNDVLTKLILKDFQKIKDTEENYILIFFKKDASNPKCFDNKDILKQTLLMNLGYPLKNETTTTRKHFLEPINELSNKNFHQFKESIEIFNEYLNTTDILWKYLLLYHILENFSYRQSISKTLRSNLSLNTRHLGRVYTSSKGEGEHIKKAIKQFINNINDKQFFNEATSTIELKEESGKKLFILDFIDETVKNVCSFLDIPLTKIDDKKINLEEFSGIIYSIRNCVVHNKETEWIHINSSLLKQNIEIKDFFEYFLLPTLEFIVKELILKENEIIDYPDDKPNYILIWGDDPSLNNHAMS